MCQLGSMLSLENNDALDSYAMLWSKPYGLLKPQSPMSATATASFADEVDADGQWEAFHRSDQVDVAPVT